MGALVGLAVLVAASAGMFGAGDGRLAASQGDPRYDIRGIYGKDDSDTGFDEQAAIGFNVIDSGPYEEDMDELADRGLKGFVWLGGYSNERCAFRESDRWIRSHVADIAGHPAVAAYFIDDEPDAAQCPSAPAQVRARSRLVKSIDREATTFIATYKVGQFKRFARTVDVLALDGYPCSIKRGCDYSKITRQVAEADRLRVRYWGVMQAFGDDWYDVPTRAELHEQFERWRASKMEGYLVFGWKWPRNAPPRWLANNEGLREQLAIENAR